MSDAEKAVLAALSAEAKAALKALLKEVADVELPKIIAIEEQKLPLYLQPIVAGAVGIAYPQLQKILEEKIDSI
jgi:hypothetical protein